MLSEETGFSTKYITGLFRGGRVAGAWLNHPPPYIAEVKESVELYFYSSSGPS
jgi:hypothetical protein